MPKQNKTYSLESTTIKIIERLADETRRSQSAIIDIAVELYDKIMTAQPKESTEAIVNRLNSPC